MSVGGAGAEKRASEIAAMSDGELADLGRGVRGGPFTADAELAIAEIARRHKAGVSEPGVSQEVYESDMGEVAREAWEARALYGATDTFDEWWAARCADREAESRG